MVRETIAKIIIDLHTIRCFAQRIFWHRYVKHPYPYGGPQFRYFQRLARLRNAERLQRIMGVDVLIQNLGVHEVEDFEYAVRRGTGMMHGGGTLDTDRLIVARRLGLGRPAKEKAPTTI